MGQKRLSYIDKSTYSTALPWRKQASRYLAIIQSLLVPGKAFSKMIPKVYLALESQREEEDRCRR